MKAGLSLPGRVQSPRVGCPRSRRKNSYVPALLKAAAPRGAPRTFLPLARRGQLPSGTGGHLLSWACRRSRRSGLRAVDSGHVLQDCFVVLMLYDEDPTPRPRVSTPFFGVPLRLFVEGTISPEYDRRVRSPYASILES